MVSRTLSRLKREGGISLETLQRKRALSRFEGRISWFSSSFGNNLGLPLELRRGPHGSPSGDSEKSSLQASCQGSLSIPLQLRPGPCSSSGAEAGTSGFLSSADMDRGVPLEFLQGS